MNTLDLHSDLTTRAGDEIGVSDWVQVGQSTVDDFAAATDDRQWIHVDPERASRETAFGGTIAHGLLTLSLLPKFYQSCISLEPRRMGINVGFNRVRFTSPVRTGSRIRGRFVLERAERIDSGWQMIWKVTIESEGVEKPACVAEWVTRALV